MSFKIRNVPCSKCGVILKAYWLKDGVCNGCRNPHLVVVSQSKESNRG